MNDPAYLVYLVPAAVATVAVAALQAVVSARSARRRVTAAARTCGTSLEPDAGLRLERVVSRRTRLVCLAWAVSAVLAVPLVWFLGPSTEFDDVVDGLTALTALLVVVLVVGALTDLAIASPPHRPESEHRVATLGVRHVGRYLSRWERLAPLAVLGLAAVAASTSAGRGNSDLDPAWLMLAGGAVVLASVEWVARRVVRVARPASDTQETLEEDVLVAVTVDRVAENGSSIAPSVLLYVLLAVESDVSILLLSVLGLLGVTLTWATAASRSRRVAGTRRHPVLR